MRTILQIARNDLRLIFQDRSVWLNIVIIPLILTFALGMAFGGFDSGEELDYLNLDVIDNDGSPLSAELLQQITAANPLIRLCPLATPDPADPCELAGQTLSPELIEQRLRDGQSAAFLEIPAGFAAAAAAGDARLSFRSDPMANTPDLVLQAIESASSRISSTLVAEDIGSQVAEAIDFLVFADSADAAAFRATIGANAELLGANEPIQITQTQPAVAPNDRLAGFAQSVPGTASMYVLFAVMPLSLAFLRDKKLWTIQRLLTMPVSYSQIMGGKLIAYGLLGVIQIAIIFGFGYGFGLRFGSDPLALIAVILSYILAVTGLALTITTFVQTEMQASSVNMLLGLTLAPLGGAWWPLDIVPEWMRMVGRISPIAWAMEAYRGLIFRDAGWDGALLPVLVLLGMAVLFFAIGTSRLRFE